MRYTICSRGQAIGESDLAFVRIVEDARMGWFLPNEAGLRLMPVITAVPRALRASARRNRDTPPDAESPLGGPPGSAQRADLAEAFQHLQALELELRRVDGSVVPTRSVSIQDTTVLVELARDADDGLPPRGWSDSEPDTPFALEVDGMAHERDDVDEDAEADLDAFLEEISMHWSPDGEAGADLPRYQVHVELLDPDSMP